MCLVRVQIVFEAIRGPSLRSDIAIDDVSFQRGPCEGENGTAGPSRGSASVTSASSPPSDPGDVAPFSGFDEYFNQVE